MFSLRTSADQMLAMSPYVLLEMLEGVMRSLRQSVEPRWVHVALRNMAVRQKSRRR